MTTEKKITDFYVKFDKLCDDYQINLYDGKDESVAEHIFGASMLALVINSEYGYKYNISEVIQMITYGVSFKFFKDSFFAKERILKSVSDFIINKSKAARFANQCFNLEILLYSKIKNTTSLDRNFQKIYDALKNNDQSDSRVNVIRDFIDVSNRLKCITRKGWLDWNVKRNRIESDAEHIYDVVMLSSALMVNYDYSDLDFNKVILQAFIHEIGESVIGDLTQFDISKEAKRKIEYEAVHGILSELKDGEKLEQLYLDFDERKSKEGMFTHLVDKAQCDLKSKKYDEEGCVDLNHQDGNKTMEDDLVKKLLNKYHSWSKMWMMFGLKKYEYDNNFKSLLCYAMENKILEEQVYDMPLEMS